MNINKQPNHHQSHSFSVNPNDYISFLFSRVTDHFSLPEKREQFLHQAYLSLNLNPNDPKWIKFSDRIAANFGSLEINIFNNLLLFLQENKNQLSQHEIHFIANKCSKDITFLRNVDNFIQRYHSSIKLRTMMRLIYIYNGDFKSIESLLKIHKSEVINNVIFNKNIDNLIPSNLFNPSLLEMMIENPKSLDRVGTVLTSPLFSQIQSIESKRTFLMAAIKNALIFPFHMNLKNRCSSARWNEPNFYKFLLFLSQDHPWRFFTLDSMVQDKIQTLFLKLPGYHDSLATLINNKDFLKLSASAQFTVLHELQKDPNQWSSMSELLSDKQFCDLSPQAQEGVFNIVKLVSWNSIKEKFAINELECLSKAFSRGSIKIPDNQIKFKDMIKTNNFEGIEELIKQDQIQSFQKKILSHSLTLLTELKQYHLRKNPNQPKASDCPYTLTESQMKLHLGNNFKERTAFVDDTSWLKHNLDLFVEKIYSRFNFNLILTHILLYALMITDIISSNSYFILYFIILLSYFRLGLELCFPIPFPFFIERRFGSLKNELLKIFAQERAEPNKIAFYHGASGDRGAFYDLYTQLRFALTMTASINDDAITVLREFDDAFDEALTVDKFKNDVEKRWKKRNARGWYDEPAYYASRAISTNPGLFGNTGDLGECTLHYWQWGNSINRVDHTKILTDLLSRLRGKEVNQNDLKVRVGAYNDLINKMSKLSGGTLLQILIDEDAVDEVSFVTEAGGLPLNIQLDGEPDKTDKPSKLLSLQRKDPDEYAKTLRSNWRSFKKRNHLCKNYFNFFAAQQARVIAHPNVLTNPEKVTINKYDAAIPQTDTSSKTIQKRKELQQLKKQLKEMIREDVLHSIAKGVKLEAGSIANHKGLLPVQRYFQYVMRGVLNEQIEFKIEIETTLEERKKHINKACESLQNKNDILFAQSISELANFESNSPSKSTNPAQSINIPIHSKYSDLKVGALLMAQDYDPESIIELLKGYPELSTLFAGHLSTFGPKKEAHIKKLLQSFDTQKGCLALRGLKINGMDQISFNRLMRLVLVFQGLRMPTDQIVPLTVRYMAKMGFNENEILLSTNLLSCSIFEKYIFISKDQLQQSRAKTEEVLKVHANQCGAPFRHYFILQYLLQSAQAASGPAAKYYKPVPELNGLLLPESQPDLKEWIDEFLV